MNINVKRTVKLHSSAQCKHSKHDLEEIFGLDEMEYEETEIARNVKNRG